MKKSRKRTDPEASQNTDELLSWIEQKGQMEAYKTLCENAKKGHHPSRERLHDYSFGWLSHQDAMEVRLHIAFCKSCADTVIDIKRTEQETDRELAAWADEEEPIPLPDISEHIVDEYWEPAVPGWAELSAAADIPRQHHTFQMKDGHIDMECSWERSTPAGSAYIWLSWSAEIETDRELSVLFIEPETQKFLYRVHLRRIRIGEERFTSEELGFDPAVQRWAITIR